MRTASCLLAALVLTSTQLLAQDPTFVTVSCGDCGGIRYHHPECVAQKGVSQKGYYSQPQSSPLRSPQEPQGQFLAGPARGPVQGESNGVGISGPALRFPAFTLPLPSLDLPNLFRIRNSAKMLVGQSEAYFDEGAAAAPLQMMMSPNISRGPAASPGTPDNAPNSPIQNSPIQHSSPLQKMSHQSASLDPAISQLLINQQKQLDLLAAQLGQMQQVLVSAAERLPATTPSVQRSSYTQPAPHVEPARLPFAGHGLRRLPTAR